MSEAVIVCIVCGTTVRDWEHTAHLKACEQIAMSDGKNVPLELPDDDILPADRKARAWTAMRRKAEQQAMENRRLLDQREGYGDQRQGPTDARPAQEPPAGYQWDEDKLRNWYQHHPPIDAPPGKVKCQTCLGLSHMYPDCVPCDGTGWVAVG